MPRPRLANKPIFFQTRVPPDLAARIDAYAARVGATRSRVVLDAMRRALDAPAPAPANVFEISKDNN